MIIKKLSRIAAIIAITAFTFQIAVAQKTAATSKITLVNQLINLTIDAFPSFAFQKGVDDTKNKIKKELVADLTGKLDLTDKYTPAQKSLLKPKMSELVDKIFAKFDASLAKHVNVNNWVKESLTDSFSKNFTTSELRQLVTYFKGADGKVFNKFIENAVIAGIKKSENNATPKPEVDAQTEAIVGKFLLKPIGDRYLKTFIGKTTDDIKAHVDIAYVEMMKDLETELTPEGLNKLVMEILEKG